MTDIVSWGDAQQYHQDDRFLTDDTSGSVVPRVTLLWMTPEPLYAIASMCAMYEGRVVRSLDQLNLHEAERYFQEVQKTHLKAPLEAVQFQFLIDGVDRSFTHQMVRQRTAVFAQESQRFAVVNGERLPVVLPPSLMGTEPSSGEANPMDPKAMHWRQTWDEAIEAIGEAYDKLVNSGMPAEEARGLLPNATATRIVFNTNLRNLAEHAGNRLCTQAQFHWRMVFAQMVQAIRLYDPDFAADTGRVLTNGARRHQYETIADSNLFRPVCYAEGRCPFKASFDRGCSIRPRVEANAEVGRPSSEWGKELDEVQDNPIVSGVGPQSVARSEGKPVFIGAINPIEWMANPGAART